MPVSAENERACVLRWAMVTTTVLRYSPRQRARTPSHELPLSALSGSTSATAPSPRALRCASSAKCDARPALSLDKESFDSRFTFADIASCSACVVSNAA